MRVLFSGGGTAGHITPALAISEILEEEFQNYTKAFVGRAGGAENLAIENLGHTLFTLDLIGLRRSISTKNIQAIYKLIRSMKDAKKIIDDFSPDLIIGTGGYVCYPIIKTGLKKNIPCLIHEANAYPGLVTRIIGHKCDKVMLGMEDAEKHLPKCNNISYVGNPIRRDFQTTDKRTARKKLNIKESETLIVSFGGSLGSEIINNVIIDFIKEYSIKVQGIRHIHACGKKHFDEIRKKEPELCDKSKKCQIVPYIDNMPTLLSASDISITRSGAMTIAELMSVNCFPILIPSPNVTANHQFYNAIAFSEKGRATLIEEKELSLDKLRDTVISIINNKSKKQQKELNFLHEDKRCKKAILEIIKTTLKDK